jgi:hypothetical protein
MVQIYHQEGKMMEAITGNPTGPEITGSFHKKQGKC